MLNTEAEELSDEQKEMMSVMGFSGFTSTKVSKARCVSFGFFVALQNYFYACNHLELDINVLVSASVIQVRLSLLFNSCI